jgi:hypothetical protein
VSTFFLSNVLTDEFNMDSHHNASLGDEEEEEEVVI